VDNKCPFWKHYAERYANHLTDEMSSS